MSLDYGMTALVAIISGQLQVSIQLLNFKGQGKKINYLGILHKCRIPPSPLLGTPVSKTNMVYFAFKVLWSIFGLHQNVHFLVTILTYTFGNR